MLINATHLNLIPVLRNKYGVTEHSNTFGIGYGRITGCITAN